MTKSELTPEDQARVDHFVSSGYNDVERRPFRPFLLLICLLVVLTTLSGLSYMIAVWSGVL